MWNLVFSLLISAHLVTNLLAWEGSDQYQHVYVNNSAEAVVGFIMPFRSATSGVCDTASFSPIVLFYEAMRTTFSLLNQKKGIVHGYDVTDSYIPGVQIGLNVYDFCTSNALFLKCLAELLPEKVKTSYSYKKEPLLIGLMAYFEDLDLKTLDIIKRRNIPIFGTSVGVYDFPTISPNIFSLTSKRVSRSKEISDLIKHLGCNKVFLIYENIEFDKNLASVYEKTFQSYKISITKHIILSSDLKYEQLRSIIQTITKQDDTFIVLTIISNDILLQKLLEATCFLDNMRKLTWIMWDFGLAPIVLRFSNILMGSFVVDVREHTLNKFREYLTNLDATTIGVENPWYTLLYMDKNQCCLPGITIPPYTTYPTCNLPATYINNRYLDTGAISFEGFLFAHFISKALKNAWTDLCKGQPGMCPTLQTLGYSNFFEKYVKSKEFILTKDDRIVKDLEGYKIIFNPKTQTLETKGLCTICSLQDSNTKGVNLEEVFQHDGTTLIPKGPYSIYDPLHNKYSSDKKCVNIKSY